MLEQYERYSDYEYSGEQWLGDVPVDWDVEKLKYLFSEKRHTQNLDLQCGSISFGEVVTKDDEKVPLSTKASYQEVLEGEFLINPLNLNYDLKSLRIALSKMNVVVSAGYIVLDAEPRLNKQYYKYLMHQYDVAYMKLLGSGVRQTISFNHISNSLLPFPPPEIQTAIANFLDDKTAKIDRAIAIKEAQIARLEERKQILIQTAVTRGLDPNVPMKDSRIDWVGEIPEHWEVKKLKHLVSAQAGYAFPSTQFSKIGTPIIRISDLKATGQVSIKNAPRVPDRFNDLNRVFGLKRGDILMAMTGGTIGKTAEYVCDELALVNQRVCRFRNKNKDDFDFDFFKLFVETRYWQSYIDFHAFGGAQPNISDNTVLEMVIPTPTLSEQKATILYFRKLKSNFSKLISSQHSQIRHLKEYRASLINAAVTGKIKVPSKW